MHTEFTCVSGYNIILVKRMYNIQCYCLCDVFVLFVRIQIKKIKKLIRLKNNERKNCSYLCQNYNCKKNITC